MVLPVQRLLWPVAIKVQPNTAFFKWDDATDDKTKTRTGYWLFDAGMLVRAVASHLNVHNFIICGLRNSFRQKIVLPLEPRSVTLSPSISDIVWGRLQRLLMKLLVCTTREYLLHMWGNTWWKLVDAHTEAVIWHQNYFVVDSTWQRLFVGH